jgi:hypothetical protein
MFAGPNSMSQTTSWEQKFRHRDSNPGRSGEAYPNQLDYSGSCQALEPLHQPFEFRTTATLFPIIQELRRRP